VLLGLIVDEESLPGGVPESPRARA
jgi:hypothetical protein